MDTGFDILVIILSVTLAIFLILAITVAILAIKLFKTLNRIADKAESVVESAETVGRFFKTASGPLAVFKLIHNIVEGVGQHGKREKK